MNDWRLQQQLVSFLWQQSLCQYQLNQWIFQILKQCAAVKFPFSTGDGEDMDVEVTGHGCYQAVKQ